MCIVNICQNNISNINISSNNRNKKNVSTKMLKKEIENITGIHVGTSENNNSKIISNSSSSRYDINNDGDSIVHNKFEINNVKNDNDKNTGTFAVAL